MQQFFSDTQRKTGQVLGREVHHWANWIRLEESPELKMVGGGRGLAEKINYVHPILAVLLGSLL